MLCVYLKAGKPEKKDCVFKNSFRVGRKYPEIIDVHCAVLSPSAELLLFMHCAWAVPVSAALFPIPHTCQGCCHAQPHPGPRPAKHRCLLFIIIYFYYYLFLLFIIIFNYFYYVYYLFQGQDQENEKLTHGDRCPCEVGNFLLHCMVCVCKCQENNCVQSHFFPFFFFLFVLFLICLIIKGVEEGKGELKVTAKEKKIQGFGQSKYLWLQFRGVKSCRIWLAAYLAVHRNQMMRCLNFITLPTANCALTVLLSLDCRHKIRDCLQHYSRNVPKQNPCEQDFFMGILVTGVQKASGCEWESGDVSAEIVFVLQLESVLLLKSNF